MTNQKDIHRGDIYFADLGYGVGSEQTGFRPVVIIQNDLGNLHSPTVIVAPITSQTKGRHLPTHVQITGCAGVRDPSLILAEQIRTLDKRRLDRFVAHLDTHTMEQLDEALVASIAVQQRARNTLRLCPECVNRFSVSSTHVIRMIALPGENGECDNCESAYGRFAFYEIVHQRKRLGKDQP